MHHLSGVKLEFKGRFCSVFTLESQINNDYEMKLMYKVKHYHKLRHSIVFANSCVIQFIKNFI